MWRKYISIEAADAISYASRGIVRQDEKMRCKNQRGPSTRFLNIIIHAFWGGIAKQTQR